MKRDRERENQREIEGLTMPASVSKGRIRRWHCGKVWATMMTHRKRERRGGVFDIGEK